MTAQAGDTAPFAEPLPKSGWRRLLRQRRASLGVHARRRAARRAGAHLLRALARRGAACVAVYLACGSELSTDALIAGLRRAGTRVFVPKLRDGCMRLVEWRSGAPLRRNRFGIPEPAGRARRIATARLDAIVLPLTGFDAQGLRLGTGGGYYDRLLAAHRQRGRPWRVGYAYALQQVPALPAEPWDVRLHAVCTERGLQRLPCPLTAEDSAWPSG